MPSNRARLTSQEGGQNGVGDRVRERRLDLGLTQSALAGRLAHLTEGQWNPSETEIAKIENSTRRVIDLELRVLVAALECSVAYLWGDEDRPIIPKVREGIYSHSQPRRRVRNTSLSTGEE
jgi:transcriptional regulator with XRE-family HTH domain